MIFPLKKTTVAPLRIGSIADLHRLIDLPKPLHPLVSLFDNTQVPTSKRNIPGPFVFDFYNISFKKRVGGRTGYGQHYYDFDEGTMMFTAPQQVLFTEAGAEYFGTTLLFHPDYIRNHGLGLAMKRYGFFSYDIHEALHLSEEEKGLVLGIFGAIETELRRSIDDFSQDIVISQIETLLNYSNRFYKRQFITRKAVNHDVLAQLERILADYFDQGRALEGGIPTVEYVAEQLHLSPRYLSDLLRSLTGQNAQQHIHERLIERAKEKLSGTNLSVSEIAYELGFGHPQSFSKLFKLKTRLSPVEFRQSFN